MLKDAAQLGGAPEFRAKVEQWVSRLLDRDWEIVITADDTISGTASAQIWLANKEATVRVNPLGDGKSSHNACHEIVHIMLDRMGQVAQRMIGQLPADLRGFADKTWTQALEEVTEELTRRFLAAYGEKADG